jgi:hypothetical protein
MNPIIEDDSGKRQAVSRRERKRWTAPRVIVSKAEQTNKALNKKEFELLDGPS